MRYARACLAVGASSVLVVAGCSSEEAPAPSTLTTVVTPSDPVTADPTTDSMVTETVTETATATAVPTGTLPAEQAASDGARLAVAGVRVGQHEGFDRVVFDLAGTGTPGWTVRFTEDPRRDGSGDRVEIAGRSVIQVTITGIGYPSDTGVEPFIGAVGGEGGVTQVDVAGPFEGQAVAFIGSAAENPAVRISTLSSPTRLVVDIAR